MCSHTCSHSAMASITSGVKSCGCGDVNRILRMPSTRSTSRRRRANTGRRAEPGTVRSRPYVLTFWPRSVTSTTPFEARCWTSERMSPIERDRCDPRTSGTMQKVHALSQPTATETHARTSSGRAAGSALGNVSVYSRTSICGPSTSARRRSSSRCGSACVPTTTSTHGAFRWISPWSFCARQPATTILRSGRRSLSGFRCPRFPYSLLSAFSRIAHVLSTITRASDASSVGDIPSDSSRPPIRSESCSFIWHPKVRIRYFCSIGPQATRLPGVLGRADLADHRDLDLAGVLELLLHLFRDVPRDHLCGEVVDRLGLDQDADLTSRLHRVDLLDPGERVADLFEPLQTLDVGLERLATSARPAATYAVGDLRQHRVDRPLLHLAVMRLDAMDDLGILLHAAGDLGADDRVRSLHLVRDGLADVVQERAALGDGR